MKKTSLLIVALAIVCILFTACKNDPLALPVVDESGKVLTAVPTITVTGESEISLLPDMANISFGVQAFEKESAEVAMDDAAKAMIAIEEALRALGVANEDMQTSNYDLYESYKYDSNGNRLPKANYNVSNVINVKIYNIDDLGSYIDKAVAAGATNVYSVSFSVKDPKQQETLALNAAMENARSRADALAAATGKKVKDVVLITDGTKISEDTITEFQAPMAKLEMADDAIARSAGTTIQPGSLTITGKVSVRFTME